MMNKTKNNARGYADRLSAAILWGATLIGSAMCAVMAVISMPAAIFAFGLMMLAFYVLHETNRRHAWEAEAQKNLPSFDQSVKIAALQNTVDAHAKKLRSIDQLVHENRVRLNGLTLVNDRRAAKRQTFKVATAAHAPNMRGVFNGLCQVDIKQKRGQSYADIVKNTAPQKPHKMPKHVAANDEAPSFYNALSDTVINEMVHASLRRNDVSVFTQNIMRLPQRSIRAVEVFSRVRSRPNHYIPAARYIDLARDNKTLDMIEPLLLMRCLEALKHAAAQGNQEGQGGQKTTYFINITQNSLKNKVFMTRLLGFLKHNRALASSLVFEMPQAEFNALSDGLIDIIKGLGRLGCAFSLDHVRSFKLSPATLQAMRVHFIKVDATALMKIKDDAPSKARFKTVKRSLERRGIGVIAEKIEDAQMLSILKRFDLHYGQGYVFDKPQIMRPSEAIITQAA